MKPYEYLRGMKPAPDAPMMDNPSGLYCPQCREKGGLSCNDPGMCGNLRPMQVPASQQVIEHAPQPSKPAAPAKPVQLDTSRGQTPIQQPKVAQERQSPPVGSQEGAGHAFDRLMGRRTTIKSAPLVDGEEKSWDWFMENVQRDIDNL